MYAPERTVPDAEAFKPHFAAPLELDEGRSYPRRAQILEPAFLHGNVMLAPCIEATLALVHGRRLAQESVAPKPHARREKSAARDGNVRRAVELDCGVA